MALEIKFSVNNHPIGSLVIVRTAPKTSFKDPKLGVGTYRASLKMGENPTQMIEGVRHVRADGAAMLLYRVLKAMFEWESMGR